MAETADPRDRYPATLRHSTAQPGLVYQRSAELFARFHPDGPHGARRDEASGLQSSGPQDQSVRRESIMPQMSLRADDGTRIDVFRGAPDQSRRTAGELRAVYVEPASGRVVVPTGRVLVRFREAVQAEAKRDALQAAGFGIVAVLGYAPHCAWVEASSGDPAQSLQHIDRLETLADVENVEPQWLSPRAMR